MDELLRSEGASPLRRSFSAQKVAQSNLFTKSLVTTSITLSLQQHTHIGNCFTGLVQNVPVTTTTCIIAAQNSGTNGVVGLYTSLAYELEGYRFDPELVELQ